MEVLEITKDDFAPFGEILTMENPPAVNIENEFDWHITAESIRLNKFCCTGLLNCRSREKEVVKMECHKKTSEILIPLNGNSILAVAHAQDSLAGNEGIKAFRLPAGKIIVMKPGTWHWIPFPEGSNDVQILVLFRDRTGDDDLNIKDLAGPLAI